MHEVVETYAYNTAANDAGMTAEERELAVLTVSANPEAGDLMVGTGGCRKLRLAGRGKGKSGGYRLITFYRNQEGRASCSPSSPRASAPTSPRRSGTRWSAS